jgi:hypothetical protein
MDTEGSAGVNLTLTHFGTFLKDDDTDFLSPLPLQLLQAYGGTETGGTGADYADVNIVRGPFD